MIYKLATTKLGGEHLIRKILYKIDERKHIIKDPNRIIGRWFGQFKYLFKIGNERDGNMMGLNLREDYSKLS